MLRTAHDTKGEFSTSLHILIRKDGNDISDVRRSAFFTPTGGGLSSEWRGRGLVSCEWGEGSFCRVSGEMQSRPGGC